MILNSVQATYLVKGKLIEIVPLASATSENEDGSIVAGPLVTAVFKEKQLCEAIAQIGERFDLTVVVSPQAGEAKVGLVTARLLNVPAEQALELLAVQADLRVVRKSAAFLITSRDHADAMFNEQVEKKRAMIELERLQLNWRK